MTLHELRCLLRELSAKFSHLEAIVRVQALVCLIFLSLHFLTINVVSKHPLSDTNDTNLKVYSYDPSICITNCPPQD